MSKRSSQERGPAGRNGRKTRRAGDGCCARARDGCGIQVVAGTRTRGDGKMGYGGEEAGLGCPQFLPGLVARLPVAPACRACLQCLARLPSEQPINVGGRCHPWIRGSVKPTAALGFGGPVVHVPRALSTAHEYSYEYLRSRTRTSQCPVKALSIAAKPVGPWGRLGFFRMRSWFWPPSTILAVVVVSRPRRCEEAGGLAGCKVRRLIPGRHLPFSPLGTLLQYRWRATPLPHLHPLSSALVPFSLLLLPAHPHAHASANASGFIVSVSNSPTLRLCRPAYASQMPARPLVSSGGCLSVRRANSSCQPVAPPWLVCRF